MSAPTDTGSPKVPDVAAPDGGTKEPYQKPAFRHEKVFETMALACGKVSNTQASCHSNRKNS